MRVRELMVCLGGAIQHLPVRTAQGKRCSAVSRTRSHVASVGWAGTRLVDVQLFGSHWSSKMNILSRADFSSMFKKSTATFQYEWRPSTCTTSHQVGMVVAGTTFVESPANVCSRPGNRSCRNLTSLGL